MGKTARVKLGGEQYVILPAELYDRLTDLARAAALPALPTPDQQGNYPAVEYARVGLARKLIRERVAARLSQRELARLAGVRFETICRIETGRHTPSVPTLVRLQRALRKVTQQRKGGRPQRVK